MASGFSGVVGFSRWTCTHVAMAPVSWYQVGRIGRHLQQVIDGPGAVRRTTYKEMDYWEKTDNGSVVWPAESEVTTHQCYHIQKNILIDKWIFITIHCEASKIGCEYSTGLTGVYPPMCAYTSCVFCSQQQPFKFFTNQSHFGQFAKFEDHPLFLLSLISSWVVWLVLEPQYSLACQTVPPLVVA